MEQKINKENFYQNATNVETDNPTVVWKGRLRNLNELNPLYKYQEYINPAPVGIDTEYALQFKGGRGSATIKYIVIESGWILDHVGIKVNTLPCTGYIGDYGREHGTAVLGIINMQENSGGGIGIAPSATGYLVSVWRSDKRLDIVDAIKEASAFLDPGDILLLEVQDTSPYENDKVWPVELDNSAFEAIRSATQKGIIVIEPAGNGTSSFTYQGGNDLDEYQDNSGEYLFNRIMPGFRDSGAIMVGAAESSLPHKRIGFSNYGSRVNCYAWGQNIVTASRYPLDSGAAINTYTDKFCGTSGATAIIAGAAIVLQSVYESKYHCRLNPVQMRAILGDDNYGTQSENGRLLDKIGIMPDLRKILVNLMNAENGIIKDHFIPHLSSI